MRGSIYCGDNTDGSVDGEYNGCLGPCVEYLTSLSIDTKMIFKPIEVPKSVA
jgi:hypothetical protein